MQILLRICTTEILRHRGFHFVFSVSRCCNFLFATTSFQLPMPNDSSLIIRFATPDDVSLLAELGAKTFSETFAKDNTSEDMAAYLATAFNFEEMATELNDPLMISFIAEIDSVPVGYAQLRRGEAPLISI